MSIEKFNPRIYGEQVPYLQANVNVVQQIDNSEAGFVWIYLLTLPPDWKVVKNHLKSHFNFGDKKLKKIFSYLRKANLIEYVQNRNENGQMGEFDIRILNGSKFVNPSDETARSENGLSATGGSENRWVSLRLGGESASTYNTNNTNETKNKIYSSSDDERHISDLKSSKYEELFNELWNMYPRKQQKKKAKERFKKISLDKIPYILDKLKVQIQKDHQYEPGSEFIPMLTTYLNGERWNDEIVEDKIKTKKVPELNIKNPIPDYVKPKEIGKVSSREFAMKSIQEMMVKSGLRGQG